MSSTRPFTRHQGVQRSDIGGGGGGVSGVNAASTATGTELLEAGGYNHLVRLSTVCARERAECHADEKAPSQIFKKIKKEEKLPITLGFSSPITNRLPVNKDLGGEEEEPIQQAPPCLQANGQAAVRTRLAPQGPGKAAAAWVCLLICFRCFYKQKSDPQA